MQRWPVRGKRVKTVPVNSSDKRQGPLKHYLLALLITAVVGAVYYYFELPAINLQNTAFYGFFLLMSLVFCAAYLFVSSAIRADMDVLEIWRKLKQACVVPLLLCALLLLLFIVGGLLSSVLFRWSSYKDLLEVSQGDFALEVEQISFDQIPMLDKASSQRLGDRKLGELSDMVSQFEVASDYPQINYKGRPVRVTPLVYGDFFKWLNNFGDGIPAYIYIDMVSQNAEVVRLPSGMRYSRSDKFFRNIDRYLRFHYPTYMFESPHMEIDDSGVPYWVCPRIVKTIGLFGGSDIRSAALVNAITGETGYYQPDEIPIWVDQVYSASLIIEQYDYYGTYQDGFINSLFAQRGVTVTTEGYNYIAQNDDVYVYTGITSVGGDESNIGFILTNQRTKHTRYYPCAGAEEYSAMSSAEGVVQHLGYQSTFPLLLNVAGQPTYFMSLKDNAGLVKMYAMVNVQQYNIVASGSTVLECEEEYIRLLNRHGISDAPIKLYETTSGAVEDIRTAVIEGNTWYYFKLVGSSFYYAVMAAENEKAVLVDVGDRISLEFREADEAGGIIAAKLLN